MPILAQCPNRHIQIFLRLQQLLVTLLDRLIVIEENVYNFRHRVEFATLVQVFIVLSKHTQSLLDCSL